MTTFSVRFRFRAVRERANLSITELAARANISRNTISHLEHGKDVKLETLMALSVALNVPAYTWLLPDKEWFDWFCTGNTSAPLPVEVQPPQRVREQMAQRLMGDSHVYFHEAVRDVLPALGGKR